MSAEATLALRRAIPKMGSTEMVKELNFYPLLASDLINYGQFLEFVEVSKPNGSSEKRVDFRYPQAIKLLVKATKMEESDLLLLDSRDFTAAINILAQLTNPFLA